METEAIKWGVIPVGVIGGRCDDDEDALDDDVAVDDDDALSFSMTELMTALLNRDELFPLVITASGYVLTYCAAVIKSTVMPECQQYAAKTDRRASSTTLSC